jgi:hypothetical protein
MERISSEGKAAGSDLSEDRPYVACSGKQFLQSKTPVVTVVGKAFFDLGHAPKDQSNRRKKLPEYAVWEIHPVMKLNIQ